MIDSFPCRGWEGARRGAGGGGTEREGAGKGREGAGEGANDFALALLDFDSLADYEQYRARLAADPDAQANVAFVRQARAVLAERRSFLRKV